MRRAIMAGLFLAISLSKMAGQSGQIVQVPVAPVTILWMSDTSGNYIRNPAVLLKAGNGQADLSGKDLCYLTNGGGQKSSMIFDFGTELQGSLRIVTGMAETKKPVVLRIRFGESVSETLSETDSSTSTATNDHAMRDFQITLPWLGSIETGNSGFRFVRIDLLGENSTALLKEVNAISKYRDIPQSGSFRCNDEQLNMIWETGARTVHLRKAIFKGTAAHRLNISEKSKAICSFFPSR